jgi:hypothetical protein
MFVNKNLSCRQVFQLFRAAAPNNIHLRGPSRNPMRFLDSHRRKVKFLCQSSLMADNSSCEGSYKIQLAISLILSKPILPILF